MNRKINYRIFFLVRLEMFVLALQWDQKLQASFPYGLFLSTYIIWFCIYTILKPGADVQRTLAYNVSSLIKLGSFKKEFVRRLYWSQTFFCADFQKEKYLFN